MHSPKQVLNLFRPVGTFYCQSDYFFGILKSVLFKMIYALPFTATSESRDENDFYVIKLFFIVYN